jgi:2-polyprenyl-3-methyl-5-hydroxy-6-metoxy-1,4-benzoquinol methylase
MRDAHYADPRLVDLYDGLNSADHDHRFYEARIGQDPLRVLDLGCGTGLFARRLAGAGHRVTGLDPSAAMLDWARAQDPVGLIAWHLGKIDDLRRVSMWWS